MDISDKIANEMPILSVYSHSVFFASRMYIVYIYIFMNSVKTNKHICKKFSYTYTYTTNIYIYKYIVSKSAVIVVRFIKKINISLNGCESVKIIMSQSGCSILLFFDRRRQGHWLKNHCDIFNFGKHNHNPEVSPWCHCCHFICYVHDLTH